MQALRELPLLVLLTGFAGAAMLLPAAFAFLDGDMLRASAFGQWGPMVLVMAALVGVATRNYAPRNLVRSQFLSLLGAYLLLPPLMAVPITGTAPGLDFSGAWFEMVSAFTTTGATVLDVPADVPEAVHLWRAIVGWGGGFFVLLIAIALLAPLNLGGLEVVTGRPVGRAEFVGEGFTEQAESSDRLVLYLRVLGPIYIGLTATLWLLLVIAGDTPFVALCHAMAILSTSGISPVGGPGGGGSGMLGEALMLIFLVFSLSRRALPGRLLPEQRGRLRDDPEFRAAILIIAGLGLVLLVRQWIGATMSGRGDNFTAAGDALWATLFTIASFLTTTGFVSAEWAASREWAGLPPPVLLLAGLALTGGGIATTAGGIKLMRVYALFRHGQNEVDRLITPSIVAGGGRRARRLRTEGAWSAWIAFALFIGTLAGALLALTLNGMGFERALILSIAALTTTGPLAAVAAETGQGFSGMSNTQFSILGITMILGRLEMLAIVALLVPESWRS